jgi:outer membrane protein assembly factor BamB
MMRSVILSRVRSALPATALALALGACAQLESMTDGLFGDSDNEKRVAGERIALMPRGADVLGTDVAFAGKAIVIPGASRVGDWSQPGGNTENLIGNTDAPLNFNPVWSVEIGVGTSSDSAITATPIIANGMVFTLDAAANVRAFDVSTGGQVWGTSLAPGEDPSDFYFYSSPGDASEEGYGGGMAYADGRLIVATGFREVVALDVRTGGRLWSKAVETPFRTAPSVRDGRVYTMNRDNRAWALDAGSGAEIWTHEVFGETGSVLASASPASNSELVIMPYTNGDLYALRANNGRPLWSDSLTRTGQGDTLSSINDIAGRPVIDGFNVYAISHAGRMVAIDTRSGERLWTRDIAGVQSPVVAGSYLFVVSLEGVLYAIEKTTGRIAWDTYLGRWQDETDREDSVAWSGPLLAQGHLILLSTDGRMVSINASNGGVEQTSFLDTGSIIAPTTANGMLFILNDDGVLTAYQ